MIPAWVLQRKPRDGCLGLQPNTGLLRARTLRFNFACPLDAPLFL